MSPSHATPSTPKSKQRQAVRLIGLSMLFAAWACPVAAATISEPALSAHCAAFSSCTISATSSGQFAMEKFNTDLGVLTGAAFHVSSGGGTLSYSGSRVGYASHNQWISFNGHTRSASTDTSWDINTSAVIGLPTMGGGLTLGSSELAGLMGSGYVYGNYGSTVTVVKMGTSTWSRSGGTATASAHSLDAWLNYTSLAHANASFASGSDVNAATLTAGDTFSIWALGGANTTLMDGVSLSCTGGDCGAFSVSLANTQNLAAGGQIGGSTALLGTVAGRTYNATYTLLYADDNAVGLGQRQNSLTLNLTASIPTPVPEPGSAALMLGGLAALGARRRKAIPH